MLFEWLKNWDRKYSPPTWKKVVIAVSASVGGDNPREAIKIGKTYKGDRMIDSSLFIKY